ncbi:hypothetical protein NPIL_556851, partial [Nephila pilipes]
CDCWKNGENCTFNAAGGKQCDCYPRFTRVKTGNCVAFSAVYCVSISYRCTS